MPTATTAHLTSTKAHVLEIVLGDPLAENSVKLTEWKRDMTAHAATTLPHVASAILLTPGTPFKAETEPKVGSTYKGVTVTKALLPSLLAGHVKYRMAVSDQLLALYNLIMSCLGPDTKAMLENQPLYSEHKLNIPGDDKVHLLLKAIHLVCTTREGSTKEAMLVELMDSVINFKMGNLSFSAYCEQVQARCDAVRVAGVSMSEALEVVIIVRGLERDFLPIKEALEGAAAVTGAGLPQTRADLRSAVVRIEATLGNQVSAFATRVEDQAKKGKKEYAGEEKIIFDEGFKKGARRGDARIKVLEEELAAAKLAVSELEKEAGKTAKAAEKAKEQPQKTSRASGGQPAQRSLRPGERGINQSVAFSANTRGRGRDSREWSSDEEYDE